MSIQYNQFESESNKSERKRLAIIDEFRKIVEYAKTKITVADLIKYGINSRLEIMILDSAFKGFNLNRLDFTLLIIPKQYIDMLQKLTFFMANILIQQ